MTARIALLLSILACLPAGTLAFADDGPAGQFLPALGDRDGDGLPDAADCAADDPTRPARAGVDLDCDGTPDGGGSGAGFDISGPADGGPDPDEPGEQTAASRPSTGTTETKTAARRASGRPVIAVRGLRLGPAVAIYAPSTVTAGLAELIFVAKDNTGITVDPSIVVDGERVALRTRTRSVSRGRAWVLEVRSKGTRRVRFAIAVVDTSGDEHTATRAVPAR